jgi:hypothetical protein
MSTTGNVISSADARRQSFCLFFMRRTSSHGRKNCTTLRATRFLRQTLQVTLTLPVRHRTTRQMMKTCLTRGPRQILISTSCGTARQPPLFARACCKAPQRAPSARRAQEFAVLSRTPASRPEHEGIQPFRVRGRPLSRLDPAIPAHRRFECLAGDSFLCRASSIRTSRREKALRLCTAQPGPAPLAGPTKRD